MPPQFPLGTGSQIMIEDVQSESCVPLHDLYTSILGLLTSCKPGQLHFAWSASDIVCLYSHVLGLL